MVTMHLIRHGQTHENLKHIFQGHLPGHLTQEGEMQALSLGERLKDYPFDVCLSSDLKRSVDTVHLALPELKDVVCLPLLREIDWGQWTGLQRSESYMCEPPEDAETHEMLYSRAGRFLDYLVVNYDEKIVLVFSHGLFCRFIQARIEHVPLEEIKSRILLMQNTEIRSFHVPVNWKE